MRELRYYTMFIYFLNCFNKFKVVKILKLLPIGLLIYVSTCVCLGFGWIYWVDGIILCSDCIC